MDPQVYRRQRPSIDIDYDVLPNPVGFGTYGVVKKAFSRSTRRAVAVKEFKQTKEFEGVSQTAIREVALLRELRHDNIVTLLAVYVDPVTQLLKLVYAYAEHDLHTIVMHHFRQNTTIPSNMLCAIAHQLLTGVEFLHKHWIVHRDLKPSNILVMGSDSTECGVVKIADFGLARSLRAPMRPMHTVVVTIWYRAPELLLGARNYGAAIDMWSVGAILGELYARKALFDIEGQTKPLPFEAKQVEKIFRILGTPSLAEWPEMEHLADFRHIQRWNHFQSELSRFFIDYDERKPFFQLIKRLLSYNPDKRITATEALAHDYFAHGPPPDKNVFGHNRLQAYGLRNQGR